MLPEKVAKVLCASVLMSSLMGIFAVANSAELPVKAPPAPAPTPPPFSWAGFYIGCNVGAAWSDRRVTDTVFGLDFMNQGNDVRFIGGGQVGANCKITTSSLALRLTSTGFRTTIIPAAGW